VDSARPGVVLSLCASVVKAWCHVSAHGVNHSVRDVRMAKVQSESSVLLDMTNLYLYLQQLPQSSSCSAPSQYWDLPTEVNQPSAWPSVNAASQGCKLASTEAQCRIVLLVPGLAQTVQSTRQPSKFE
jgi:hypothetical protein